MTMTAPEEAPSPTSGREAVAGEVRALMARHRTKQEELARELGISQQALSRRLRCVSAFDVDEVYGIARFFGIAVTRLFADSVIGRYPHYAQVRALDVVRIGVEGQTNLFTDAPWYDQAPRPGLELLRAG